MIFISLIFIQVSFLGGYSPISIIGTSLITVSGLHFFQKPVPSIEIFGTFTNKTRIYNGNFLAKKATNTYNRNLSVNTKDTLKMFTNQACSFHSLSWMYD